MWKVYINCIWYKTKFIFETFEILYYILMKEDIVMGYLVFEIINIYYI